jgi:6-phosphofructokinase 1
VGSALTTRETIGRIAASDLEIRILGSCRYPSPLTARLPPSSLVFVGQADRILMDDRLSNLQTGSCDPDRLPAFELAGPRDKVFFDVDRLVCGIVTSGGLCPGLNNVIRALVLELTKSYGVKHVLGFRYGYEGLLEHEEPGPLRLTPEGVADIHHRGGSILGTSRGNQDPVEMADRLEQLRVGVLFVIGGDDAFRGAMALVAEISGRGLPIGVIGIPMMIDNDLGFIDKGFGFDSAFSAAVELIRSAKVEAQGSRNGIGVVKLMGRHSGFIACHAALAATEVDVVLIPEVPIELEGSNGFLAVVQRRLRRAPHAVVVVADGAGHELCVESLRAGAHLPGDAIGRAHRDDIGVILCERLADHFRRQRTEITLKYLDASHQIRSLPASPPDSLYCWNMARHAVHAAMAGNTELLVGRWHGRFVHVPMSLVAPLHKQVDITGDLWSAVIELTGQPASFGAG